MVRRVPTVLMARQVGSVANLTNSRFGFGVGIGFLDREPVQQLLRLRVGTVERLPQRGGIEERGQRGHHAPVRPPVPDQRLALRTGTPGDVDLAALAAFFFASAAIFLSSMTGSRGVSA